MPSYDLLNNINNSVNFVKINAGITTAGGKKIGFGTSSSYESVWSSSEYSSSGALHFYASTSGSFGMSTYDDKYTKISGVSVRPVMCFGENCDDSRTANGAQGDLYYCNGKVVGVKTPNMDFYVALKDFSSDYWKNAYNTIKYNMFCEDTLAYMPTKDDLVKIYNNKNSLDDLFEKYGGKKLSSGYYWSETDSGDSSYRYVLNMSNGSVVSYHVNTTPHFVRIVLKP